MFNSGRGFTKMSVSAVAVAGAFISSENCIGMLSSSSSNQKGVVHAEASAPSPLVNMQKVKAAIGHLIEADAEKRNNGTSLKGTFVRLAWHCAERYSQIEGDSGCEGGRMRFDPESKWGANAGLGKARDALEPIKAKFPLLSYADLYAVAGVTAIEESGGPSIPFRFGRIDDVNGENSPPDGRLPDADKGGSQRTIAHIRDIFYRIGMNDQEIVVLIGAHALGRCHTDASGYWGPWNYSENTMSNEYFRLLLEERWSPKISHNGKPWSGPNQYEDKTGMLMMLPSDIALLRDPDFRKYVELYAKDEDLLFQDFAKAFAKLLELGVPFPVTKPWYKLW